MSTQFKCTSAVLKVASLCNLNCSYCYMYNLGDETYKSMPKYMSKEVVETLIRKIGLHCRENKIPEFTFVLHGGEPMLAGPAFFKHFVESVESGFLPAIIPFFNIQSNATLLTPEWCEFLEANHIALSVSLDGYREINDQNRVYHNGKGSFEDVVKGIKLVNRYTDLKVNFGVLSVINVEADPRQSLELLQELDIINIDYLFPNANFDKPPYQKNSFHSTEYGDWLIAVFNLWYTEFQDLNIRFFTNIISTVLGNNFSTDSYGEGLNELIVIETDGGIEAVDVLKICGNGFTKEGLNILTHELEEAFEAPLIREYILSHESLPDVCQKCSLDKMCASGYLPHRYSKAKGFNNPSVYCHDLAKLITHIRETIIADFPPALREEVKLDAYSYSDFLVESKMAQDAILH
jgi:uncharacterized protein